MIDFSKLKTVEEKLVAQFLYYAPEPIRQTDIWHNLLINEKGCRNCLKRLVLNGTVEIVSNSFGKPAYRYKRPKTVQNTGTLYRKRYKRPKTVQDTGTLYRKHRYRPAQNIGQPPPNRRN